MQQRNTVGICVGILGAFLFALTPIIAIASGTWATKAPLPESEGFPVAGVISGKIYAVRNTGDAPNVLQIYDPGSDTWSAGMSMPSAPTGSGGGGAIGGKLYVVGGCVNADCNSTTGEMFIYDPVLNTWTSGTSMTTTRGDFGSAVLNGKLYVVGGVVSSDTSSAIATLEIYDPVTNMWSTGAHALLARRGPTATALNGKIYLIGGQDPGGNPYTDTVQVYDPVSNSWSFAAPLIAGRTNAASSVLNGKVHVMGGFASSGRINVHDVYDPSTNSWSSDTPLTSARGASSAVTSGSTLYIIGGNSDSDPNTGKILEAFTEVTSPPHPTDKDQCKKGGYVNYVDANNQPFPNQGQCVSYVNHH